MAEHDVTDVLRVDGISKRYGATVALDRVRLAVRAGEVHAVIGENGAGKSTLMGVLAGAIRPDHGGMQLRGEPYAPASPFDARQKGVTLIHQELSLCPHLTVAENVLLGSEISQLGWIDRARMRDARARAARRDATSGDSSGPHTGEPAPRRAPDCRDLSRIGGGRARRAHG